MVVRVTKDQEIYIPFMKLMELRVLILWKNIKIIITLHLLYCL